MCIQYLVSNPYINFDVATGIALLLVISVILLLIDGMQSKIKEAPAISETLLVMICRDGSLQIV